VRNAVVIARRFGTRSLAAEAVHTLQDRRLCRLESKVERELARLEPCLVLRAGLLEHPVIDPRVRAAFVGACEAERRTCRALVMHELSARGIAQCGMRDHELAGRERAGIRFVGLRPAAKERDLESRRRAARAFEPARDVPPFGAESRVAAFVLREADAVAGGYASVLCDV
jgi:hypothetical protein